MLCGLIIVSATMTRFLGSQGVSPAVADRFLEGLRFDLTLFGSFNIHGLLLVALRILNTYRCGRGKGVDCVPDASFQDDDGDDGHEPGAGAPRDHGA